MDRLGATHTVNVGSRTDKQRVNYTSFINRLKTKAIKIMAWPTVVWTVTL